MGIFDQYGDYDENSFWYFLRSREDRALDQAVKANRKLASLEAQMYAQPDAPMAPPSAGKLVALERQVLGLALYARTLLQLLLDKGVVTPEEFEARLRELDEMDGKLDGK